MKFFFTIIALTGCYTHVMAQQYLHTDSLDVKLKGARHYLNDGGSSFMSQPVLFKEIDMSSYELLSGSLSFSDKDQTQKLIIAPFKLLNKTEGIGQLVNTKFNVTLKEKITTIGIGLSLDNSSYYSKRAQRIRSEIFHSHSIGVPGVPAPVATSYEIFLQQLIARIQDSATVRGIKDTALIAQIKSANRSTMDSLYDLYHRQKLQEVFAAYQKAQLDSVNKQFDSLLLQYDKAVARHVFRATIAYNFQLFPNLFSQGNASDFDSLNYHNIKSHNISGSVTYSYKNNWLVITAGYNQIYAYTSAEKLQKKVPYYGPAINVNKRIWRFVSQESLDTMASYKKSLFVPSLNVGCSFEGKYADGAATYKDFYQDKAKRIVTWMPYIDFLFAPALQFRIGLPITKMSFPAAEKQTYLGANVQYNVKLSNLAL